MPRMPREEVEGGMFHVYARGNDRRLIFLDDEDRRRYLAMLAVVIGRTRWHLLAYCLMDNHVHLLIETPLPNLGAGIQRLHGHYAIRFNSRHRSSGHLFQGRYGAVRARTDAQLHAAAVYIACNPLEAGMCERPEHWEWSSHAATLGGAAQPWLAHDRLLAHFAAFGGEGRERYREAVDERAALRRAVILADPVAARAQSISSTTLPVAPRPSSSSSASAPRSSGKRAPTMGRTAPASTSASMATPISRSRRGLPIA
jgi:REP element-mobilizing transposase RayT